MSPQPTNQVVEIAPAPNLAQEVKDALYADAVKLAKHVGYRNAGARVILLHCCCWRCGLAAALLSLLACPMHCITLHYIHYIMHR